jgi:DNA-binding MarR family transcriptional regulator
MAESAAVPPASPAAEPGQPPGDRGETVASVAESFTDLQRTVRRSKARLLAAAGNDVESASQILLHTVGADGPMRASALAVSVQSDLSTVSRQVAVLVGRGLLERQADQLDGRASLLAVTADGRAAIAEHEQGRHAFFDEVLTGWGTEEMREFARQLERFTVAYDHVHAARMNEMTGRPGSHPGSRTRGAGPHHPVTSEEGPEA